MQKKPTRKMKFPSAQLSGLIGKGILMFGLMIFLARPAAAADINACADCHEEHAAAFKNSPHGAAHADCTSCHGDSARHIEAGGGVGTIFSFKMTDTANAKAGKCLSCHQDTNSRFFASSHGKAAMDCTNCHSIHAQDSKIGYSRKAAQKSCFACHEDVFAQFKLNERHRLQEGILGCSDCHNPHEPASRERLGGFKHETCLKCHTEKGGPFIYEHGASRIEGCTACHEVHGSPNRHMLHFQNSADLCFSCHNFSPNWHAYFQAESTNCATCHSTIHGSNLDRLFLR